MMRMMMMIMIKMKIMRTMMMMMTIKDGKNEGWWCGSSKDDFDLLCFIFS